MDKESSSNEKKELANLIIKYELDQAEGKLAYWDSDQLANIAEYYTMESMFNEAQQAIDYGLELHPKNTNLLIRQGYLYLSKHQLQLAREVVDSITESYHEDVKFLEAEILLSEDKPDEAEAVFNSIENLDDVDILIDIATTYLDLGYPEKTQELIDDKLKDFGQDKEFLIFITKFYQMTNQAKKAVEYYNRLIDSDSFNPSYWTGLAKCYFIMEKLNKSIEACNYALASDDKYGEAYLYRGHDYYQLGNMNKALEDYNRAIEYQSPSYEMAYVFLGLIYTNKADWEKAIFCNKKAIEILEESNDTQIILVEAYANLATAVSAQGLYEEAHSYCERAKEIQIDEPFIYLSEARIYFDEKKPQEADNACKTAMRYANDSETWHLIATFFLEYEMFINAQYAFQKAYELAPSKELLEQLAIVSIMNNDLETFNKFNDESDSPLNLELMEDVCALLTGHLEKIRSKKSKQQKKAKKKNKDNNQT
ncbi:MAG TPA: tetratricopeptide repeat protein [Bacteroides reticulotermitis]|nr:tetratricopeptide repeat protein [Bacteroides reticulotermitis]